METSQNTIFFLPPILKPTRNYSHTYNQMLQSTALGERGGKGPTASHGEPDCTPGDTGAATPLETVRRCWSGTKDAGAGAGRLSLTASRRPPSQFALIYELLQQPNPFSSILSFPIKYLIINSKFLDYKDFFFSYLIIT